MTVITTQPCGHPVACIDEGTNYCRWCADVACLKHERDEARALAQEAFGLLRCVSGKFKAARLFLESNDVKALGDEE